MYETSMAKFGVQVDVFRRVPSDTVKNKQL